MLVPGSAIWDRFLTLRVFRYHHLQNVNYTESMKVLGSQPCSTPFPLSLPIFSPFSLVLLENLLYVHCQRAP